MSSRYQSSGYAIEAYGSAALENPGGASGRTTCESAGRTPSSRETARITASDAIATTTTVAMLVATTAPGASASAG